MKKIPTRLLMVVICLVFGALNAQAATIVVTNSTDADPGSLRDAVSTATAGDTITFAAATDGMMITLTSGEIMISNALTIIGNGPSNTMISGNNDSRIFNISNAGTVSIASLGMTNGQADDRGGAILTTDTEVNLDDVEISDSVASGAAADEGGGAITNVGGDLTITNSLFMDNTADGASGSGGAILNLMGGSLTIMLSDLWGNQANRAGGAIEDASGAGTMVTLEDVFMEDNSAVGPPGNGGAVHISGDGDITITGGVVSTNSAASEGGGLWNGTGTMIVQGNALISNNTAMGDAADNGGGGIFNNGGTLTVDGGEGFVSVSGNTAGGTSGSGGGIFSTDGMVTLMNVAISANNANRAGGGIEVVDGFVMMSNSNLIGNDLSGFAGMPNPGNGAGLHVTGMSTTVTIASSMVAGNVAAREGGGLWNQAGSTMTITDGTTIDANCGDGDAADDGGGGIFNNGGTLIIDGSDAIVTISNNFVAGTLGSGGGIFNGPGGTVTINDAAIINNRAERAGGGIEDASDLAGTVAISMTDVQLDGNSALGTDDTAPGNGGGLHVTGASDVEMVNGTANGNFAAWEGGGLWNGTGTMTVNNVTADGNTASGTMAADGGGAFFNNGGTLTIMGSTITNNVADGTSGSGGGIFNNTGGTLMVSNSTLANNSAMRAGGGIEDNSAEGSTVTITDVDFTDNSTAANPGNGGAIHISGAGDMVITGGNATGNTAASEGGAFWNGLGTMTIDNVNIDGNNASGDAADNGGGGVFNVGGTLIIQNGTMITNNTANGASGSGGGVFNDRGGMLNIMSSTISNNSSSRAGGGIEDNSDVGTTVMLTDVTITNNSTGSAPGNGGGVHITGEGAMMVSGGTVSGNTAASEGGGLWNGTGVMTLDGVTIEDNTASGADADTGGGGLFNNGGTMIVQNGTTVNNNIADGTSGSGGGILSIGGAVTVNGGMINGNAANRAGGAIEIAGGTLDVTDTDMMNNDVDGGAGSANPGNGGALHISGYVEVSITGGNISGNAAANEGGGLWNSSVGILDVTEATIDNNTATVGGGVYTQGGDSEAVRVTVMNMAPDDGPDNSGLFLTPVFTAFHDGTYDTFNDGEAASDGLERIAEDGATGPIIDEFMMAQPNGVAAMLSNGPIAPGATASSVFVLDPAMNRFYTYASMVIPSNDAFISNGDPQAYQIFDGDGNFTPVMFTVPGAAVWDAGTEENTEMDAAFFDQTAPNTGTTEGGVVSAHPGFMGSQGNPSGTQIILGGTQTVGPGRTFGVENADFTRAEYNLLQVTVETAGSGTTLTRVTVSGNNADGEEDGEGGGGIFNDGGHVMLATSTVSGNSSSNVGGGVLSIGETTIENSTIANNSAGSNGGGIAHSMSATATTLYSTIVADNTADGNGDNVFAGSGSITSNGWNLIGDDDADALEEVDSDILDADPMLGALANNGGSTQTHALLCGSPAIDAGDPDDDSDDQRGEDVFGGQRDIGAFELQDPCDGDDDADILRFVLVNADRDVVDADLMDDDVINLNTTGDIAFNIQAIPSDNFMTESVVLELSGPMNVTQTENLEPYEVFGNGAKRLLPGDYTLTATPYSGNNASGTAGEPLTISFTVILDEVVAVTRFRLVNADREVLIDDLTDGTVIDLSDYDEDELFNIQAITTPDDVGSVVFDLDGPFSIMRTENVAPYEVFGNGALQLLEGMSTISATPYNLQGGQGAAGMGLTVSFTVVDGEEDMGFNVPNSSATAQDLSLVRMLDLTVFPNPAQNYTTIDLATTIEGMARIRLIDPTGRIIQELQTQLTGSDLRQEIDLSSLVNGTYTIQVITDDTQVSKRLVITK